MIFSPEEYAFAIPRGRVQMRRQVLATLITIFLIVPATAPSAVAFDLSSCTINGTSGNDTIQGTSGDDVICGKGGYDVINAGSGNDIIFLSSGQTAEVNLEDGDDFLDASLALAVTADGGPGNDEIIGSPGNDTLNGGLGAAGDEDVIYAGSGNDIIDGEEGEILTVTLGEGDDTFNGGEADASTVLGGDGEDTITGTPGVDDLSGNGANDVIWGVGGEDVIQGGNGDDIVAGGDGVDSLNGGWGLNNCDYTTNEPRTTTCVYDDAGPVVSSIILDKTSVDVTNANQVVHVNLNVTDQTGVRYAYLYCYSTNGDSQKAAIQTWIWINEDKTYYTYDYNSQLSETHAALSSTTDISFSFDATVLKGHKPGTYSCNAYAYDVLNQYGWYSSDAPTTIEVLRQGDGYDDVGPTFESFSVNPTEVDVSTQDQKVSVNLHLTDQTGVKYGYIYCTGDSLKAPLQIWFWVDQASVYVYDYVSRESTTLTFSGTKQNMFLEMEATVKQGQKPGIYSCFGYSYDELNLYSGYYTDEPKLTVIRTGDGFDDVGPELTNFVINPDVVEVGVEDAPISVDISFWDQNGIDYGYIYCYGDSNKQPLTIWFDLNPDGYAYSYDYNSQTNAAITVTGDLQDVNIHIESVVKFGTKPGLYNCSGYAYDNLNQYSGFYEATNPKLTVNRTPPGQPSSPTDLVYTPDSASNGTLSWTAPNFLGDPELKDYEVQFSMDGWNWQKIEDGFSTTTSLPISNLNGGTNYWFKVRGDNGGGEGAWSQTVQITTPVPVLPSEPLNLNVQSISSNSFVADWDEPLFDGDAKITDFIVELSTDGGSSWNQVQHPESSATSMTVNGLKANQSYLIRVSSVNVVGSSTPSDVVQTQTSVVVTSKPQALYAKSIEAQSVTLSWKTPANLFGSTVTDYIVELSRDNGVNWESVNDPISSSTSLTISGLGKGRDYQFRVSAVNEAGVSEPSLVLSLSTLTTLPAAPTNLTLVSGYPTSNSVKVTWSAPIDRGGLPVTDYLIHYSRNGGKTWILVAHSPSTKRSLTLTGLKNDRNYKIRIKTVTSAGQSKAGAILEFKTLAN